MNRSRRNEKIQRDSGIFREAYVRCTCRLDLLRNEAMHADISRGENGINFGAKTTALFPSLRVDPLFFPDQEQVHLLLVF